MQSPLVNAAAGGAATPRPLRSRESTAPPALAGASGGVSGFTRNPISRIPQSPPIRSSNLHAILPSALPRMAQPISSQSVASAERVVIPNKHGEKLVGVLHQTGSKKVVVLCHGFRSSKDNELMLNLTAALTKQGISIFRFDFSGNGESEGEFSSGNYRKEVDDLRSSVSYLSQEKYDVTAIVGHSKGAGIVVLYASIYDDVRMVVNLSGRFAMERGIKERIGEEFMDRIKKDGYIDVKDKAGNVQYRVTEESLMERLNTDMRAASLSINEECRVLTVHGSEDEIIPVEDAFEFSKVIPNHKLHIIEGANHCYTAHQNEVASVVVDFIISNQVGDTSSAKDE